MSDNTPNNKQSTKYIISFSAIIVLIIILYLISQNSGNKVSDTPSGNNSNVASSSAAPANNTPDETKGDISAVIDADITFRDVDFSATQDDIQKKEDAAEDTLGEPDIAKSADGYTYITYESNPDKPLGYNGFSVSSTGTSCLTYVFHGEKLDEVRLQFGTVDDATVSGILNNITTQYGESTFYRSSGGIQTYWWKTKKNLLMLNTDSTGTTLFFRQN